MKLLITWLLLFSTFAHAQIYKCETDTGLVFSDKPCGDDTQIISTEKKPAAKSKSKRKPSGQAAHIIEKDAILTAVTIEQIDALVTLVRLNGFRCDSVSAASPFIFSTGFSLKCNNFRYDYEIEDKGGRWVVTVD